MRYEIYRPVSTCMTAWRNFPGDLPRRPESMHVLASSRTSHMTTHENSEFPYWGILAPILIEEAVVEIIGGDRTQSKLK